MSEEASPSGQAFDLAQLQQLFELMEKHGLSEVNLKHGEEQWRLRRGPQVVAGAPVAYAPAPQPIHAPAPAPVAAAPAAPAAAASGGDGLIEIKSPTVGTFYVAPSPEDPPFVNVGSTVSPTTVVCTIEAMKVFNQIPSEVSGTIAAVLVKNGEAVEFGQPLFKVRP